MRIDDVDDAHEAALDEAFDRKVTAEILALGALHSGTSISFSEALARAAFWMRVYTDLTEGDAAAALALVHLIRSLNVSTMNAWKMN